METVDYATRRDMVAALVDARNRGVSVEVVGNGRTLKFADGIGATPEDEAGAKEQEEQDALLGVVQPEVEEPEVEEPEVEEPEVEEPEVEEPEVEDDDLIGDAPQIPKRKRNKS